MWCVVGMRRSYQIQREDFSAPSRHSLGAVSLLQGNETYGFFPLGSFSSLCGALVRVSIPERTGKSGVRREKNGAVVVGSGAV
jgi:hypothetical protein